MQPNSKITVMRLAATSATNADFTASLDCLGYRYAVIDVILSTAATNEDLSTLVLNDNTSASTTNDTAIATGGTDFTIGGSGAAASVNRFCVDLRGKERYLIVTGRTSTNDQTVTIVGNLYRGEAVPNTTTEAGVTMLHEC